MVCSLDRLVVSAVDPLVSVVELIVDLELVV